MFLEFTHVFLLSEVAQLAPGRDLRVGGPQKFARLYALFKTFYLYSCGHTERQE